MYLTYRCGPLTKLRSSSLSDDDASELLRNLLRWLASSVGDQAAGLSTQKLWQALATFFIHFPTLWPNCVKSLLVCLRTGDSVTHEDVERAPNIAEIVAGLDWRLLRVALGFTNTLVTDVGKTDMRIPKLYVYCGGRRMCAWGFWAC